MKLRSLTVLMVLALPLSLMARQDSLFGLWPRGASPGTVEVGLWQHHKEHGRWQTNFNRYKHPVQGQALLPGVSPYKTLKATEFEISVAWQASENDFWLVAVPYYFQEVSPFAGVQATAFALNRTDVLRSDHVGDVSLQYRWVFAGTVDKNSGNETGLALVGGLKAPTGRDAWDTSTGLLHSGQGGWQLGLGLSSGLKGDTLAVWASVLSHLALGYQQTIPVGAWVWDNNLIEVPVYIQPGIETNASAGLEITWFKGNVTRHTIGTDIKFSHEGPDHFGGQTVYLTESLGIDLAPYLRFNFGNLDMLVGFLWPQIGRQRSSAYCGDNHICGGELTTRIDYRIK